MFKKYKEQLQECIDNHDTEGAHYNADGVLCMIAKDMKLTLEQRIELVEMYHLVDKWFA